VSVHADATTSTQKGGKLATGAIIGIVVGCVVAVILVIVVIIFIVRRKGSSGGR
jgi:hypothetical protein